MKLGVWDVDGMMSQMPSRLFMEWQIFDELEPFGPERDDIRTASIVSTLANVFRSRGSAKRTVADSLLLFGDMRKPRKSWQQMKAIAATLSTAFGGKK
jgi:hypothetical protein